MTWADDVMHKDDARTKIARELMAVIHEQVSDATEGNEEETLLIYLLLADELVKSVSISIRSDQSRKMLLKDAKGIQP